MPLVIEGIENLPPNDHLYRILLHLQRPEHFKLREIDYNTHNDADSIITPNIADDHQFKSVSATDLPSQVPPTSTSQQSSKRSLTSVVEEESPTKGRKRKPFSQLTHEGQRKRAWQVAKLVRVLSGSEEEDPFPLLAFAAHHLHKDTKNSDNWREDVDLQRISSIFKRESRVGDRERSIMIHDLAEDIDPSIPINKQASLANVSRSTYYRFIQSKPPESVLEDVMEARVEPKRGRACALNLADVPTHLPGQLFLKNWLMDHAPVKSGQKNYRVLQDGTFEKSYAKYKAAAACANSIAFGMTSFLQHLHAWYIHPAKFDQYGCPTCQQGHLTPEHKGLLEAQFDAFHRQLKEVEAGQSAMIIMDYCRMHELGHVKTQNTEEGHQMSVNMKLSCLGFVLLTKDLEKESTLESRHFDFFSVSKQTGAFFQESVEELFDKMAFLIDYGWKFIYIWGDGGMETAANLTVLGELQKQIADLCIDAGSASMPYIQASFFPPYHGHNRCDAHFGVIKKSLRQQFPSGASSVDDVLSVAGNITNTQVFRLKDAIKKRKATPHLYRATLTGGSPRTEGLPLPFKGHKTVLFDPFSIIPYIIYPSCSREDMLRPIRAIIRDPGVRETAVVAHERVPSLIPEDLVRAHLNLSGTSRS